MWKVNKKTGLQIWKVNKKTGLQIWKVKKNRDSDMEG